MNTFVQYAYICNDFLFFYKFLKLIFIFIDCPFFTCYNEKKFGHMSIRKEG